MYQGKIKTWFNFLTHMTAACKGTAVSCWRGKHCSSEAISVKLWTWIPVILTIEPANMAGQSHLDFTDLIEQNWDFPCTLAPLTLRGAKEKGLEYVVVSHIFKNHNHFITRSIVPTPGGKPVVFTYDGMKHAGFSQLERGSIDDLMTGSSPPVPKGYYTYAVIYRLCGGPSAQDYFASRQLELIQKKLHVNLITPTFLLPGFREMAETERVWVTSHYSLQPHSWEFCHLQPKSVHETNTKVKSGKEQETKRLSVPPISALPDDFDTEDQVENHSNNDEFVSPVEDILHSTSPLPSSSPLPSTPLPILCRCGADSDGNRDEIEEPAIECVQCHNFSHLACQTYRLSAGLTSPFKCHMCNLAMPRTQRDISILDVIQNGTSTTQRSRCL